MGEGARVGCGGGGSGKAGAGGYDTSFALRAQLAAARGYSLDYGVLLKVSTKLIAGASQMALHTCTRGVYRYKRIDLALKKRCSRTI